MRDKYHKSTFQRISPSALCWRLCFMLMFFLFITRACITTVNAAAASDATVVGGNSHGSTTFTTTSNAGIQQKDSSSIANIGHDRFQNRTTSSSNDITNNSYRSATLQTNNSSSSSSSSSSSTDSSTGSNLRAQSKVTPNRDETCRRYLIQFLNGTTDAKDECQGFYNAIKGADCAQELSYNRYKYTDVSRESLLWNVVQESWDEIRNRIQTMFQIQNRHKNDNGTIVDDDVVIDDTYENWECCTSLTDYYEKRCAVEEESSFNAFQMLGIVTVLVICGLMKSMIRITGCHWIPDAGACIVVGAIVGGMLRVYSPSVVSNNLTFNNDLFLQIMLPPIVFQAALTIDKRAFRRDIFPILTLAIFGTGFSAVVNGYLTYYLSSWFTRGESLPLLDSLLFGALMSSIDPIATLSILSSVGIVQTDTLYILIFGESLLNDGVAIVLFNSLVQHLGSADDIDRATVHHTIRDFLVVTIGSIFIGTMCGTFCTIYFWSLSGKHNAVTEVAMFFTWALVPYYLADGLGLSGIISTMVMGFLLDFFVIGGFQSEEREWMEYMSERIRPVDSHHRRISVWERMKAIYLDAFSGRGHIDEHSRHHVGFVAEVIANLMETAIFAYLGLFLFNDKTFNIGTIFSGLFSSVSSRALMVILFSLLINACVWIDLEALLSRLWYTIWRSNSISIRFDENYYVNRDKVYLNQQTQLIMFAAGVRGAVSYALVQNIPIYDAVTKHGSKFKHELRAMTAFTVVVLLFTFGALTYFIAKKDQRERQQREYAANSLTTRLMSTGLASDIGFGESAASGPTSLELDEQTIPSEDPTQ
jgi:NhaP-type Na+/H+ or K+/H+ antiporter